MFKKIVFGLLAAMIASCAFAANAPVRTTPTKLVAVYVKNEAYGSGAPGTTGWTLATPLPGGLYFVPQYLAWEPSAATVWPRVVTVPCKEVKKGVLFCQGFHWLPSMGSPSFLLVHPVIVHTKKPKVVVHTVIKEVPMKRIRG